MISLILKIEKFAFRYLHAIIPDIVPKMATFVVLLKIILMKGYFSEFKLGMKKKEKTLHQ